MISKVTSLAICVAVLVACAHEPVTRNVASSGDSFAAAYAAAEAALAEAEANRNVWSKTESLLQQSKVANDDGRVVEAVKLANEAKLQAELALAQAISQEADWEQNILVK